MNDMKNIYILIFLTLVCLYIFKWRERSLEEMEKYAVHELEFIYGSGLSSLD